MWKHKRVPAHVPACYLTAAAHLQRLVTRLFVVHHFTQVAHIDWFAYFMET